MDTQSAIIEINGLKMEVDLRHARRIEHMRVGERVKVLVKEYSSHAVYPGVIVGFEPFSKLPTIVVAYATNSWSGSGIKFLHYNAQTKDAEIVVSADVDFEFDRDRIIKGFDRSIAEKRREISSLEEQKAYFETHFKQFWHQVVTPAAPTAEAVDAG